MGVDKILLSVREPDGSQRFHQPDQHPATARLRREMAKLRAFPESPERNALLAVYERDLARFELGEYQAKLQFLRSH